MFISDLFESRDDDLFAERWYGDDQVQNLIRRCFKNKQIGNGVAREWLDMMTNPEKYSRTEVLDINNEYAERNDIPFTFTDFKWNAAHDELLWALRGPVPRLNEEDDDDEELFAPSTLSKHLPNIVEDLRYISTKMAEEPAEYVEDLGYIADEISNEEYDKLIDETIAAGEIYQDLMYTFKSKGIVAGSQQLNLIMNSDNGIAAEQAHIDRDNLSDEYGIDIRRYVYENDIDLFAKGRDNVHDLSDYDDSTVYDLTQSSENIRSGDILKLDNGRWAIMVDYSPVMVVGDSNSLHRLDTEGGYTFDNIEGGRFAKSASKARLLATNPNIKENDDDLFANPTIRFDRAFNEYDEDELQKMGFAYGDHPELDVEIINNYIRCHQKWRVLKITGGEHNLTLHLDKLSGLRENDDDLFAENKPVKVMRAVAKQMQIAKDWVAGHNTKDTTISIEHIDAIKRSIKVCAEIIQAIRVGGIDAGVKVWYKEFYSRAYSGMPGAAELADVGLNIMYHVKEETGIDFLTSHYRFAEAKNPAQQAAIAIAKKKDGVGESRIIDAKHVDVYYRPVPNSRGRRVVAKNIPVTALEPLLKKLSEKYAVPVASFEWTDAQGVKENIPQPGKSSGKAKQFNPNAKVQTKEMTLDQILSTVKGIPYVNNVVDDWDAKDYSWGVTKKVIEYAQYLQKNPQSVANLPPLVVIDGQLNDGAHRLSAINLLQKRMDPKNPLWKQVKLKVNFGTSADVAPEQGVAEGFSNDMSTEDMIAYLRQHHDTNLHQDYLDHINTFSKFVLQNIPVNSIKTDLPKLDKAKVEQYKQMDFSKAPPIVIGGGYILDGYHRANVAKALGIPTIKAYVGVQGKPGVAENFADGRNPGRKGLAKRSGVNTKASVSSLRKTAKNSSGEKQRMAHWLANMKAGRAKSSKVKEDAAGVGVVKNSRDPRYVMATAGDQNDVTADTMPKAMRAYGLIGRKSPGQRGKKQ